MRRVSSIGNPVRRSERYTEYQEKAFARFESFLDTLGTGPFWLKEPVVAGIVSDALHRTFTPPHDLICFCLMTNHIHILCTSVSPDSAAVRGEFVLTKLMRLFKGSTARVANLALGRQGPFWQHESYDHAVRDEPEMERFFWYVLMNPVKARLVESFEEWPWTYWRRDFLDVAAR